MFVSRDSPSLPASSSASLPSCVPLTPLPPPHSIDLQAPAAKTIVSSLEPRGSPHANHPQPHDLRRLHRRLRRRRRHGRQGADRSGRRRRDARGRADVGSRSSDSKMFEWSYDSPRRGAAIREAAVRRVRRGARRLDARRRALHERAGQSASTGSGRGCSAGAPITGAASRCASVPTTSAGRASTASATTGRSPTTTSSRTTTEVDTLVGIFGTNRRSFPNEPDGIFLPPPQPRCYELLIKQASDKLNIPCVPSRLSILTQAAERPAGVPLLRPVRPRLRDALELLVAVGADSAGDGDRQAAHRRQRDGARGDGRRDRPARPASPTSTRTPVRENHVRARIVVLAASACESARILLNSKSSKFPQGLGNSSGNVGKYLTDSDRRRRAPGFIPKMMDQVPAQRGRRRRHAPLHAVVARQQEARLPARLPHRDRRRPRHARRRVHRRHSQLHARAAAIGRHAVRRLRREAEGGLPAPLRRDGQLRRPRRDGPEQGQLLRDRSAGRRQVRHPGACASTSSGATTRRSRSKHMQETFRAIIHGDGRHADVRRCRRGNALRAGGRRADHPRARRHAHGQRSEHVGAEQELPGARREERLRRRRRAVRVAGRQELHLDDPGAGDAHERVHRRRAQEGHDSSMANINRRSMLGTARPCRSRPASRWTDAEAAAGAHPRRRRGRRAARTGVAFKPKFFTAHEYATVRVLVDLIIPKDERSGSATDAGVPEFMDFMMVDEPGRQTPMRGGLAWIDLECQRPLRQAFPRLRPRRARRRPRRHRLAAARRSRSCAHGVAFFNSFRDLTATGFWSSKMGVDGPPIHGQHGGPEWKGCPTKP